MAALRPCRILRESMRDRDCNRHPPVAGSSSPPDETALPPHGSLLAPRVTIRCCCGSQRVSSHNRLPYSPTLVEPFRQARSAELLCCRLKRPLSACPLAPAIGTSPLLMDRCPTFVPS